MNPAPVGNGPAYRGFTVIELMIVIAIVGVLAAIAVPIYNNLVAKAQFAEAFSLANGLQATVAERYGKSASVSASKQLAGIDSGTGALPPANAVSGRYVAKAAVDDGVITLTFSDASALAGKHVTLTPQPDDAHFSWQCATDASAARTPASCR